LRAASNKLIEDSLIAKNENEFQFESSRARIKRKPDDVNNKDFMSLRCFCRGAVEGRLGKQVRAKWPKES
jgi:hypothetical protein